MQSNTAMGGFSVNGVSERNNNFLLDGVDNNAGFRVGNGTGVHAVDASRQIEFTF